MVTKRSITLSKPNTRSVLAKIHMVTKLPSLTHHEYQCSVLAKIHMVTKHPS